MSKTNVKKVDSAFNFHLCHEKKNVKNFFFSHNMYELFINPETLIAMYTYHNLRLIRFTLQNKLAQKLNHTEYPCESV